MTGEIDRLKTARRQLGLSFQDLWVRYIGVGGRCDAFALRGYLTGRSVLADVDHDHIVLALNEALDDACADPSIAYRLS